MNLKIRIIWKICMNLKHGIDIIYSLKHHKDFRSDDLYIFFVLMYA